MPQKPFNPAEWTDITANQFNPAEWADVPVTPSWGQSFMSTALGTAPAIVGGVGGSLISGGPWGGVAGGAIGSGVGSALRQGYEMNQYDVYGRPLRSEFNLPLMGVEAGLGAIPGVTKFPGFGSGIRELAKFGLKTGAEGALIGAAGTPFQYAAETGEWNPSVQAYLQNTIAGGVTGAGFGLATPYGLRRVGALGATPRADAPPDPRASIPGPFPEDSPFATQTVNAPYRQPSLDFGPIPTPDTPDVARARAFAAIDAPYEAQLLELKMQEAAAQRAGDTGMVAQLIDQQSQLRSQMMQQKESYQPPGPPRELQGPRTALDFEPQWQGPVQERQEGFDFGFPRNEAGQAMPIIRPKQLTDTQALRAWTGAPDITAQLRGIDPVQDPRDAGVNFSTKAQMDAAQAVPQPAAQLPSSVYALKFAGEHGPILRSQGYVPVPGKLGPGGMPLMARPEAVAALQATQGPINAPIYGDIAGAAAPNMAATVSGGVKPGQDLIIPASKLGDTRYLNNLQKAGYTLTGRTQNGDGIFRKTAEPSTTNDIQNLHGGFGMVDPFELLQNMQLLVQQLRQRLGRQPTDVEIGAERQRIQAQITETQERTAVQPGEVTGRVASFEPEIPTRDQVMRMGREQSIALIPKVQEAIEYWHQRNDRYGDVGDIRGAQMAYAKRQEAEEILRLLTPPEPPDPQILDLMTRSTRLMDEMEVRRMSDDELRQAPSTRLVESERGRRGLRPVEATPGIHAPRPTPEGQLEIPFSRGDFTSELSARNRLENVANVDREIPIDFTQQPLREEPRSMLERVEGAIKRIAEKTGDDTGAIDTRLLIGGIFRILQRTLGRSPRVEELTAIAIPIQQGDEGRLRTLQRRLQENPAPEDAELMRQIDETLTPTPTEVPAESGASDYYIQVADQHARQLIGRSLTQEEIARAYQLFDSPGGMNIRSSVERALGHQEQTRPTVAELRESLNRITRRRVERMTNEEIEAEQVRLLDAIGQTRDGNTLSRLNSELQIVQAEAMQRNEVIETTPVDEPEVQAPIQGRLNPTPIDTFNERASRRFREVAGRDITPDELQRAYEMYSDDVPEADIIRRLTTEAVPKEQMELGVSPTRGHRTRHPMEYGYYPNPNRAKEDLQRRARNVVRLLEEAAQLEEAGNIPESRAKREQANTIRQGYFGNVLKKSEEFFARAEKLELEGDVAGANATREVAERRALEEIGQMRLQFKKRLLDMGVTPQQAKAMGETVNEPSATSLSHDFAQSTLRDIPKRQPGLTISGPYGWKQGDPPVPGGYQFYYAAPDGRVIGYASGRITPDGQGKIGTLASDKNAGFLYGKAAATIMREIAKFNMAAPSGSYSRHTWNVLKKAAELTGGTEIGMFNINPILRAIPEAMSATLDMLKRVYTRVFKGDYGTMNQMLREDAELNRVVAETQEGGKKQKEYNFVREALSFPSAATTTGDFSAPGRQGLSMILTPQFWKAAGKMFGGLTPNGFKQIDDDLRSKPIFQERFNEETGEIGKSFAEEIGMKLFRPASAPGPRAEAVASRWLETGGFLGPEKVLGLTNPLRATYKHTAGVPVRATNRAFITFLNHLNANRTEYLLNKARDMSLEAIREGSARPGLFRQSYTPEEAMNLNPYHNIPLAKEIADFVNTATGHAPLKTHLLPHRNFEVNLEQVAPILNATMFSPRLFASRFRMLNPSTYVMATPFVRKQYLKAAVSTAAAWYAFTEILKMSSDEAEVSNNPTSADFGKVRIGNTRLDPAGGFLQFLTLAGRLMYGGSTSSASNEYQRFGTGFQANTAGETIQNFMSNKFNPAMKFAYDLAFATEYKPMQMGDRTMQLFVPLIVQDVMELSKENPDLIPAIIPMMFGMGSQTYSKGENPGRFISPESDWNVTGGGLQDIMPWNWDKDIPPSAVPPEGVNLRRR